ncbi:MAG: hypothetical protein PHT54_01945 [Candidatus Nanoarchaeia archaeon]|nr:hypothetical protein [Candidatus Nanoarchaeia archaeon]
MQKRGQVALFVIIGIIVVIVVGLIFLIPSINQGIFTGEAPEVREQIEGCFNDLSRESLLLVGLSGGSLNSENYLDVQGIKVSYGYYLGKNYLPDLDIMETEVSNYVSNNLFDCVDLSEYEVLDKSNEVLVEIGDTVTTNVDYYLNLKKGDKEYKIEDSSEAEFNFDVKGCYGAALSIIEKTEKDPGYVYPEFLKDIGYDVTYSSFDEEKSMVYMVGDVNSDYELVFANRVEK